MLIENSKNSKKYKVICNKCNKQVEYEDKDLKDTLNEVIYGNKYIKCVYCDNIIYHKDNSKSLNERKGLL